MKEIVGIIIVLPLFTWVLTIRKNQDIVAPVNIFTFMYAINIIIPTLLYMDTNTTGAISTAYIREAVLDDSTYITYVLLQTACYYLVVFGTKLRLKTPLCESDSYRSEETVVHEEVDLDEQKRYKHIGVILWVIGCFAFFEIMRQVGGVYYFFTHLQYRVSLTRNIDFLSWILPMVNYGTLFIVYSLKGSNKSLNFKIIILIVISGLMSGLGGRKSLIILLIEALLLYHYTVRPINIKRILNVKYIAGLIVLYLFFILMTKFRTQGAFETFLENPISFVIEANGGLLSTIRGESYVTYYMAIIYYFKSHAFWMGRTFIGLLTAFIPSSLYANKFPVDDGTYLYSICQGRSDIIPPMAFNQLNGSSFPLETFGSMYGNFGIIGLFIGMIILGGIYGYAYRKMKNKSYSLFTVVIYTQIMFTFELSTLRIIQLLELMMMFWFITFIGKSKIRIRGGTI